jgi:hypothetical protein
MTTHETIAGLRKQIADAETREQFLFTEREAISFDAVVEHQKPAIRRLEEINSELSALRDSNATLNAALKEARKREAAAAAAKSVEAERERAEKAAPIATRLAERGSIIDAAIKTYRDNRAGIQSDIDELIRLGVPVPSRDLVRVNLHRAHDAALTGIDKTARPVPPLQRHSYSSLLQGWALPAQNWISSKLNTNNAADAA